GQLPRSGRPAGRVLLPHPLRLRPGGLRLAPARAADGDRGSPRRLPLHRAAVADRSRHRTRPGPAGAEPRRRAAPTVPAEGVLIMQSSPAPLVLEVAAEVAGPPVDWAGGVLAEQLGSAGVELITGGADPTVRVVAGDGLGEEDFGYTAEGGRLIISAGSAVGAGHGLIGLADQIALQGSVDAAVNRLDGQRAAAAMPTRGIMRSFSSVDEDLPWFHDQQFWTEYLDWIARSRFSRFHLALGMQYNYGADRHGATDNYLCFAYPFLLEVDGWDVHAEGVSAEERARNLQILKFVAAETRRRGLKF